MNMRLSIFGIVCLGLWTVGCASSGQGGKVKTVMVNGQAMPLVNLTFTGQPYTVNHKKAHPMPGGPSSGVVGPGGLIIGRVCGIDINYDVKHQGEKVFLNGVVSGFDTQFNANVTIRDTDGARVITGDLGARAGFGAIDLRLTDTQITGRVGRRVFDVKVDGDRLTGRLKFASDREAPVEINGFAAMRELPPADLAAILPPLLTCNGREIEQLNQAGLSVGFGGTATNHPSETSSIYLAR
jgi:hypothetical protein